MLQATQINISYSIQLRTMDKQPRPERDYKN